MDFEKSLEGEIRRIQSEIEKFFRSFSPLRSNFFLERGLWHPFTDIIRTPKGLMIRIELAGLEKEDFQVLLEEGKVIVRGERVDKTPKENTTFQQMEISYGPFEVVIPLDFEVDSEKIKAVYEKGMLEILLPPAGRKIPSLRKKISIKSK